MEGQWKASTVKSQQRASVRPTQYEASLRPVQYEASLRSTQFEASGRPVEGQHGKHPVEGQSVANKVINNNNNNNNNKNNNAIINNVLSKLICFYRTLPIPPNSWSLVAPLTRPQWDPPVSKVSPHSQSQVSLVTAQFHPVPRNSHKRGKL